MGLQLNEVSKSNRLKQNATKIPNNEVVFFEHDNYCWNILTEDV